MSAGGGALTDAFVNLGDKLHNNFNDTFSLVTQQKDVIQKYEHLTKQLEFDKKKFGLQFALQKLQTMRGINAQEKQLLLSELTAREGVKGKALSRQIAERGFRENIISQDRKRAIGNALATGFANAMKDNAKPMRMTTRGRFGGKFDPQKQMAQHQQPQPQQQQSGGLMEQFNQGMV